jgi:hypothetical protein
MCAAKAVIIIGVIATRGRSATLATLSLRDMVVIIETSQGQNRVSLAAPMGRFHLVSCGVRAYGCALTLPIARRCVRCTSIKDHGCVERHSSFVDLTTTTSACPQNTGVCLDARPPVHTFLVVRCVTVILVVQSYGCCSAALQRRVRALAAERQGGCPCAPKTLHPAPYSLAGAGVVSCVTRAASWLSRHLVSAVPSRRVRAHHARFAECASTPVLYVASARAQS